MKKNITAANATTSNAAVAAVAAINASSASEEVHKEAHHISDSTTLIELIRLIGPVEKLERKPTPKALRENETVVAESDNCIVYANGYAYYSNDSGETVMFLDECHVYTQEGLITSLDGYSWIIGVSACGETRIEANLMNRKGDRKGGRDYNARIDTDQEWKDYGGKQQDDQEASNGKESEGKEYRPYHYPSPEQVVLHNEYVSESLNKLTERQREIYLLYHLYGYNENELARIFGISHQAVHKNLQLAEFKVGKNIFE